MDVGLQIRNKKIKGDYNWYKWFTKSIKILIPSKSIRINRIKGKIYDTKLIDQKNGIYNYWSIIKKLIIGTEWLIPTIANIGQRRWG